jgi:hypothetical protein
VFVFAACLVVLAAGLTDVEEVTALTDKPSLQKTQMDNSAKNNNNPQREGAGRFKNTANFPGTPYGKPGYKESHNWETDVDFVSPAVFNYKFYAAKYGLAGKTEAEVKADWMSKGMEGKIPNCRQGNAGFSLNAYAKNNPAAVVEGKDGCKDMMQNFLANGIYDGLSGSVGFGVTMKNKDNFPLKKHQTVADNIKITPARKYTYTFWMQMSSTMSPLSNVMHFSNKDYPRTPALFVKPASTNLQFKVAQTNDPDFGCDVDAAAPGALPLGKWAQIGLVVEESKIQLFIDGEKKCEKTNSGGGTIMPAPGSKLYLSSPWAPASRAQVRGMNYYPNIAFTDAELKAQVSVERAA